MKVKKNRFLVFFLLVAFCAGAFIIAPVDKSSNPAAHSVNPYQTGNIETIPDVITYSILFRFVTDVKSQAEETERNGKDSSSLASYFRRAANLSEQQARDLNNIASEVMSEVEQLDQKAHDVIERYKSQFPNGKVPKGVKLPPPPPELQTMQQEKNSILLRGRDKLSSALGDDGYSSLLSYINAQIWPKIIANPINR